jgi:hypothetical protein
MCTTGRRPLGALIACLAALCVTMPRPSATPGDRPVMEPARTLVTPTSALPSAFEPPDADRQCPLVAAVGADIDDDGDLDVVASDGSLHLIVWANDGTGHLTRQVPKPSLPGGLLAGQSTIDGDPIASTTFVQVNGSSLTTIAPFAGLAPRQAASRPSETSSRLRCPIASSRIPRAPPASVVL